MFKKLTELIKKTVAGGSEKKSSENTPASRATGTAAPAKPRRSRPVRPAGQKPRPAEAGQPGDAPSKTTPGSRKNSERKPRKRGGSPAAGAAKAKPTEVPPMPEKLVEVPPEEGKVRFLDMDLPPAIQFGLQDLKFSYCTPIQAAALPELLKGRDLCGKAQTGTGKTAAFLVAILKRVLENPLENRAPGSCRALIMAPTRELAIQIHKDALNIAKYTGLNIMVVFGGMDYRKQQSALDGPVDLLIGTPGRIIDFSRSGHLKLNATEILVLDEADRMLDMGFIPDVRRIVAQLPRRENRQTMLFSATLDAEIRRLASSFLNQPETVESEPEEIVGSTINQLFYTVSCEEKPALLINILKRHPNERILIFGNRKCDNLDLARILAKYGVKSAIISGDIEQGKRLKILEDFRAGRQNVLIATDVAARGIHVDDVALVVNYDLPKHPEDYVHRVGRTGRAGHTGTSLGLLDEYGAYELPAIEELLGEKFNSVLPDEDLLILPEPDPNWREPSPKKHGGRPRRR